MRPARETTRHVAPGRARRARPRPIERAGNSSASPAPETASDQEAHGRCWADADASSPGPRGRIAESRERWRLAGADARNFADLAGLHGALAAGANGRFPWLAGQQESPPARRGWPRTRGSTAARSSAAPGAPAGRACRHLPTTCRKEGGRVRFSHHGAHRE